ncbi:HPP family protein [Pseudooceanicola aestuarii]|uniref:HPP family protein n=1 Tax=Pseudooceanicola aestuarii TaxID=2697319 RepID=UPI0013D1CB67|nr:HPP family protein [Pseudooceanicola aestuarii]
MYRSAPTLPAALRRALYGCLPVLPRPAPAEVLRATIGGVLGIGCCLLLAMAWPGTQSLPMGLIAPLGASAVLTFAVPNAPLAQPWSAVMGNTLSALAVWALLSVYSGPWAPALAVGLALLVMMPTRSLHPPGGAVALLAALDPAPVLAAGPAFALIPVAAMTATLVAAAVVYNRLTGRVYPFRQSTAATPPPALTEDELQRLLRSFNQGTNIGTADLGRLLAAAEAELARHRFDGITCGAVMTAGLITAQPDDGLRHLARLFRRHAIKCLPVVTAEGALSGLVLQSDLIAALADPRHGVQAASRARRATAARIARPAPASVTPQTPVGHLLDRLALQGVEVVPVMEGDRIRGIITRSDILHLMRMTSQAAAPG